MSNNNDSVWRQIAEYARLTPSPHNTQPYRIKVKSDDEAEIVFMPDRGLYIADPQGRFTWLTAGIFAEVCTIAARGLGSDLKVTFDFAALYRNEDYVTPQTIASMRLQRREVSDFNPELIRKRHTSRLPYNGKKVPETVRKNMQHEAERFGHRLDFSDDLATIDWVVELNKDSLFYDLEDSGVRRELRKWLRYSRKEAIQKGDGLSAECLHLPGWLLRSFFQHTWFWLLPGVKSGVSSIYKSTMKGIGTIGWLQGSYITIEDWVKAGRLMIRLWLIATEAGVYWQPYGSIITNDKARKTMLDKLNIPDEDEGKRMVWLLLRLGYSDQPPESKRLPLEEILI